MGARKKREEERKEGDIQFVVGNLYALVQRMANEFRTSLQNIDPHTPDYVMRLVDEPDLIKLVELTQEYYINIAKKVVFARQTAMLHLEQIYYHYHPEKDAI